MEAGTETTAEIRFEGALTVACAEAVHHRLQAALNGQAAIEVDCSAATEIDVSFLQLLIAARRSARDRGKAFRLTAAAGRALDEALSRAGLPASALTTGALGQGTQSTTAPAQEAQP